MDSNSRRNCIFDDMHRLNWGKHEGKWCIAVHTRVVELRSVGTQHCVNDAAWSSALRMRWENITREIGENESICLLRNRQVILLTCELESLAVNCDANLQEIAVEVKSIKLIFETILQSKVPLENLRGALRINRKASYSRLNSNPNYLRCRCDIDSAIRIQILVHQVTINETWKRNTNVSQ